MALGATRIFRAYLRYNFFSQALKFFGGIQIQKGEARIVLARGVSGCLLDTLFHLSFICKSIVVNNLDTLF